jgi:thioredoxin-related protein
MKKSFYLLVLATFTLLISCGEKTKSEQEVTKSATSIEASKIQVIQFHSENRCMTCNKIEALALETLKSYPELRFQLVNVDDSNNEQLSEQFEATGTALFLYNPSTKEKLDLTEFAFMTAGDETKFETALKKQIEKFMH